MNNARRKRIDSLIDGINAVSTGIQTLRDEEEAAYDALPESSGYRPGERHAGTMETGKRRDALAEADVICGAEGR